MRPGQILICSWHFAIRDDFLNDCLLQQLVNKSVSSEYDIVCCLGRITIIPTSSPRRRLYQAGSRLHINSPKRSGRRTSERYIRRLSKSSRIYQLVQLTSRSSCTSKFCLRATQVCTKAPAEEAPSKQTPSATTTRRLWQHSWGI